MRIAVDVDNVLVGWQQGWARLYDQWFGQNLLGEHYAAVLGRRSLTRPVPHDPLAYWSSCLDETVFETYDEFFDWFARAGGWNQLEPIPGAFGGVYQLKKDHDVVLCTSRPHAGQESALKLGEMLDCKVLFEHPGTKHQAGADLWIDDSPEVLHDLDARRLSAIRVNYPWNVGAPYTVEVDTWDQILFEIKEMS